MRLWMNPGRCRGCLRCELACSYHHSGHRLFQPGLSSTRVLRDGDSKAITMVLSDSCDMCENEETLLCVGACVFGARGAAE
jgi:Fe-S-cluster-containing dehydrogenase component